ncbi:MAG: alpha-amylase family glycosyl hydrolase [Bacteroidota bacterium]|jgi:glycosidase|nr:alpha-amylase family glycosyl hydrolase [Bacteroidota bacterium]
MMRTLGPLFVFVLLLLASALHAQQADPPAWARGMTWYLLLPDRFANGDSTNDPTAAYVFDDARIPWKVSSWTANWYERTVEERMLHPSFYPAALLRHFGGDLDGIISRLDYLQDLGVHGIILTPMFEARSAHKFDVSSLHHIDQHFGPVTPLDTAFVNREIPENPLSWYMTSADRRFADLIAEVHRRGMKVLMMAQFAHVGAHFWAFRDVLEKQEASPYGGWFSVKQWDRPETPYDSEFRYERMWDVDAFPRLRQDTLGLVSGPREYVFAATRRWMDPNGDGNPADGIDGWCIDLTHELPDVFWQQWASHCRGINPDVLLVNMGSGRGKTTAPFNVDQPREYGRSLHEFFLHRGVTSTTFDSRMLEQRSRTTLQGSDALLNLLGSHETDRVTSMCVNDTLHFDRDNSLGSNPEYLVRPPDEDEQALRRMLLLLHFTLPGAPVLYYGDEAGMRGADDPDNRKSMLWPDLAFDDENTFDLNGDPTAYPRQFDSSLFAYVRALIQLRERHTSLRVGAMQTMLLDDYSSLYAFMRSAGAEKVFVVVNASDNAQPCVLPYLGLPEGSRLSDPFLGISFYTRRDAVSFVIPPRTATILIPAS